MVAIRWTARGAHNGELFGIPPSGKEMSFWGVYIYRIANGKIVEVYVVYARLPILQQLGAKITLPQT